METKKKTIIEIDETAVKHFLSEVEALERIHRVIIRAQERVSTADERKKQEILGDILFEIAMVILESPNVALLLPTDYALYSLDELSALVSRVCIENDKKVPYIV